MSPTMGSISSPSSTANRNAPGQSSNTTAISAGVGAGIGGVAIAVAVIVVFLLRSRRQRNQTPMGQNKEHDGPSYGTIPEGYDPGAEVRRFQQRHLELDSQETHEMDARRWSGLERRAVA